MAIIIGGPNNPNAYVYQPKDPGNTSVSPSNQSQNNQASYTVTGGPHSSGPRKLKKKIKSTTGTSFGPAGGGIGTFSGQNIQSAAAPTPAEVLQSIVDVKDRTKNIPGIGGLSKYQNLLQNFRTSNPANMAAYGKRFPVAQFAMTALPRMIPGIGSLQTLVQEVFKKGKSKVGDKVSGIMNTDVMKDLAAAPSGFFNDLQTMLGMNKNKKEGATTETETKVLDVFQDDSITPGRIEQMAPGVDDQETIPFYGGRSLVDEMYAGLPSTKFGREFLERMGPRENFNTVKQATTPKTELDYKLPLTNMAALLSPTVQDFRENLAGTEPYEQPVLDYAMERAPSSYNQALKMLQDKYPGKSPMDYVGMMNRLQKTPNFSRTMAFNENFLPSAETPIQFKDGGNVENFDVLKSINDTMHG